MQILFEDASEHAISMVLSIFGGFGSPFWNHFGHLFTKMLMSKMHPNFVTKIGQAVQLPFLKSWGCILSPGM